MQNTKSTENAKCKIQKYKVQSTKHTKKYHNHSKL